MKKYVQNVKKHWRDLNMADTEVIKEFESRVRAFIVMTIEKAHKKPGDYDLMFNIDNCVFTIRKIDLKKEPDFKRGDVFVIRIDQKNADAIIEENKAEVIAEHMKYYEKVKKAYHSKLKMMVAARLEKK